MMIIFFLLSQTRNYLPTYYLPSVHLPIWLPIYLPIYVCSISCLSNVRLQDSLIVSKTLGKFKKSNYKLCYKMVCYFCGHMLGSVLCHAGLTSWTSASCRFMGPSRQGGYWLGFIVLLTNVSLVIFFLCSHFGTEVQSDNGSRKGKCVMESGLKAVLAHHCLWAEFSALCHPTLSSPHLQITATLSFLSSLYLNSGKEPKLGTYKDNFMRFCGRASGQNGLWTLCLGL